MPPNPTLSSANLPVHPPPSATDRSYSSCPTIRERGSISAGCVPLRLIQPIPSTGTKAENEEGRKRLRWGIGRNEGARANYRVVARKSERQKTERGKEGKGWENEDPRLGERRKGGKTQGASRAPRATHHILLSRLPTLTAGSVPDRRSRMPTTRAGREESHARHPAC